MNTEDGYNDSEEAITISKTLCLEYNCDLLVVYIPNSLFWRPDVRADNYRLWIKDFAFKNEVKFLTTQFLDRKRYSYDYANKGPHLSPLGYQKLLLRYQKYFKIN